MRHNVTLYPEQRLIHQMTMISVTVTLLIRIIIMVRCLRNWGAGKLTWRSPSVWALGTWVIEYSACLFVGFIFLGTLNEVGLLRLFCQTIWFSIKNVGIIRSLTFFQHGRGICHEYAMGYPALPFSNFTPFAAADFILNSGRLQNRESIYVYTHRLTA